MIFRDCGRWIYFNVHNETREHRKNFMKAILQNIQFPHNIPPIWWGRFFKNIRKENKYGWVFHFLFPLWFNKTLTKLKIKKKHSSQPSYTNQYMFWLMLALGHVALVNDDIQSYGGRWCQFNSQAIYVTLPLFPVGLLFLTCEQVSLGAWALSSFTIYLTQREVLLSWFLGRWNVCSQGIMIVTSILDYLLLH